MAEIIYGKNGAAKATAKSVRYTGQFMGVPQLEVEIDGPVPLGFEVGDYIVFGYDGIRYSIMDLPPVTKQASAGSAGNAFVYDSVVFKSPLGLLANVDFLDTVLNENNVHYSTLPVFEFYGTVKDFAGRLQANINRLHTGWKVSVEGYDDSTNPNYDTLHEYSNISISNIKCSDSLSIPYETWGITYVFMVDAEGNNCIVFNHALDSTSAKRYGEGNGLYTLTKRMSTEKPVVNRLRAYGSTDNLPARYYNNLDGIDEGIYLPNLMIPRSEWKNQNDPITAYIDSTDIDENDTSMSRYGVREKSIYFDGSNDTEKIEPTIKGVTAGMIRAAKEEMGDTSNVPSATIYPDDERIDKVVEAESIADKGVESDGEVYMDSIGFNVSKGEDRTVVGTKNGLDPIIEDLETSMEISTPATYKVISSNPTPFCRFNTGVGIVVDSAILNVYTVDEDGVKNLCDSVKIYSEVISGVNPDGGRYAYRDFYFARSNGKDSPLYIKVPYKGVLLFQYNIVAGGADSVSLTMSAVSLTASTGPIILQNKFWVRIKQIGFDINSYPSTEEAKLVVNSGGCAGRSFNIVKNSTQFDEATGTWKFECFRSQDESLSQLFPNSIYKISEDDEFVLTGLEMPDLYVQMASQKLYDEAVKWLWKHKDGLEVFSLDIDNKVAYLDSVKIKEGMLLPLCDRNLNVGSEAENEEGETVITYDYRIIDSVTIEIGEEPVPVITAVLREEKEESTFRLLNKKVSEITARTTQNAVRMQVVRITEEVVRTTASTPTSAPSAVIDTSDFVTLSTEQTITGKKTFAEDAVFGADGSRLFIPSQTPGEWSLYIDPVSGVSGETPQPGGGSDVIWADSPYPGYSGLNVDGTVKDVALKGHLHAVSEISGLLGDDSRILPSLLPDYLLGQLMYGGTVNGSSVATVSAAFKDRYGVSGDTVTVNASDAAQYEGVYFIASSDGVSGVVLSLGVRTGDWVVSNGTAWTKIDNTDSVSSVAGLTGVIGKSSLQSALSDSSHRFVTDAQITSWNGKWDWDAEQVAGVKVDRAVLADSAVKLSNARRINGTQFDGTEDVVTSVWGMPRSVTVKDFYSKNSRVSAGIDGSSDFSLLLPESVRVKVITAAENVFTNLRVPQSAPVAPVSGQMYLYVDSDAGVSGEVPVSGGIDLDAMWAALAASGTEQINVSHIPSIPLSKVTGLTGAVSTITAVNLTANRVLVSNASGKVAVSAVTATELGCLDGVRSNVQTQLNNRLPLSGGTMTGAIRLAEGSTADLKGLTVSTGESVLLGYVGDDTYLAQQAGTTRIRSGATNLLHRRNGTDYAILDAYNYASYTVTKTGGGASGTWGINISGNAASATKSATRKMPEGTDLNTLGAAVSTVGFANYYKSGDISVDNAPSDIYDAAGLGFITWRISAGFSAQLLAATSGGNAAGMIFRKLNSNDNTVLRDWAVVLDSLNVDDYALTRSNYTSYTYPTTVDKISDLHSSWGTLLKAAPSVYVTRWPTAAEVGAYTKAQVDTKLAAYLPLSGGTMSGAIRYVSNSNRYLTLSGGGLKWDFSDVTIGHAQDWLYVTEPDGSGYAGMGVYGGTDGLDYIYLGGSYTAPWIALRPSGNVGIGVTSPSYRLHVGGSAYVNGTVYAATSFNLTNNNGRFVFSTESDAAYLQGKAGKRLVIGGFNGTTLPQLNLISDDTYATGDFRVGGKLLVPSSEGNNIWSISIDPTAGVSGDAPSSGGLDEEAMWAALGSDINTKVIASVHIPKATSSAIGGIRIGFPETGKNYPVELDSSGRAYVNVPWVNTTYSLSSFGITATAEEINKLDGVDTLLHSGNIGSYALTPSNYTSTLDSSWVITDLR